MSELLARNAVEALNRRGWTIATAESFTAGLLAATIAEVPGASAVLRGGMIVYATDLKESLAGVSAGTLRNCGAVSAETADELARGAARACGADIGVGLTGVSGPDPQEGHRPGTVFLGFSLPGKETVVLNLDMAGTRDEIRHGACIRALEVVEEYANESGND